MNIWGRKGVIDAKDFLTGRAVRSPPSLSSSFSLSSKVPKLLISFQAEKRRRDAVVVVVVVVRHSMESVKGEKRRIL